MWERIDEPEQDTEGTLTYRAKVPGGWLVKTVEYGPTDMRQFHHRHSAALTFLPDPEHGWTAKPSRSRP